MRAKILLADQQKILTDGLSKLLDQFYEVVATAANGYELISLAKELSPDVIVTEISMPLLNGMDALRVLSKSGTRAKFVVLTMHLDMGLAVQAFRTGASAYVLKQGSSEDIHAAVEAALHGRYYLSAAFPADLVTVLAEAARHSEEDGARLSRRQREVLQLVAEGKTMKEVATVLGISTRTAESYKYEMMRSLGIRTSAELVQYAIRIGLISVTPLRSAA
jgi:DNA-binding NarL/FixJ family response regulator